MCVRCLSLTQGHCYSMAFKVCAPPGEGLPPSHFCCLQLPLPRDCHHITSSAAPTRPLGGSSCRIRGRGASLKSPSLLLQARGVGRDSLECPGSERWRGAPKSSSSPQLLQPTEASRDSLGTPPPHLSFLDPGSELQRVPTNPSSLEKLAGVFGEQFRHHGVGKDLIKSFCSLPAAEDPFLWEGSSTGFNGGINTSKRIMISLNAFSKLQPRCE